MDDEFFVTKVYTTACTAVLLWDTVLTTRREYRALWRKQSGAHIGLKEVMYCFSRWACSVPLWPQKDVGQVAN